MASFNMYDIFHQDSFEIPFYMQVLDTNNNMNMRSYVHHVGGSVKLQLLYGNNNQRALLCSHPEIYFALPCKIRFDPKVMKVAIESFQDPSDANRLYQDFQHHLRINPRYDDSEFAEEFCLKVLATNNNVLLQLYLERAGWSLVDQSNRNKKDSPSGIFYDHPELYHALPASIRSEPESMNSAILNLRERLDVEQVYQSIPLAVVQKHPCLLANFLHRHRNGFAGRYSETAPSTTPSNPTATSSSSYWHLVPAVMWDEPSFLHELLLVDHDIQESMFRFKSDKTFFVDFFRKASFKWDDGFSPHACVRTCHLMSDQLAHDREFGRIWTFNTDTSSFVRTLLMRCYEERLDQFLDALGEYRRTFYARRIDVVIRKLDVFTFLACCWKSQRLDDRGTVYPLRHLECGIETSVALKKLIRSYTYNRENRVRTIRNLENLLNCPPLLKQRALPRLVPFFPHELMIRFIRRKLQYCDALRVLVPLELWTDRDFVLQWLKRGGKRNNLIHIKFASDLDVLRLAYPKMSKMICTPPPTIHDTLGWRMPYPFDMKSIFRMALIHPFILNGCYGEAARQDDEFLLRYCAVLCAGGTRKPGKRRTTFDVFAEAALRGGWGNVLLDLLTIFKARIADNVAYLTFSQLLEASSKNHETQLTTIGTLLAAIGSNAKKSIRSYLWSNPREKFRFLERVWECPAFRYHLSKAKLVEDLEIVTSSTGITKLICR